MTNSNMMAITVLCALMLAGSAGTAAAQTDSSSFGDAVAQLKRGARVSLTDDSGRTIKATITAVSASSLTAVTAEGNVETFSETHVRELAKRQRNAGKGAKIGLGVGAALGLLIALQQDNSLEQVLALGGATVMAGMGAGVGALVGANVFSERMIYRAPGANQHTTVAVAPILSKNRAGVFASIRF